MAIITVTPAEVASELGNRGYHVEQAPVPPEPHVGIHDVPPIVIHEPPVPPVLIHDVPPIVIHEPPEPHVGIHDVPPIVIYKPPVPPVGIHDVPPIVIHEPPVELHIPVDAITEGPAYAKYLRFLPFLVVLFREADVLDLRRVF